MSNGPWTPGKRRPTASPATNKNWPGDGKAVFFLSAKASTHSPVSVYRDTLAATITASGVSIFHREQRAAKIASRGLQKP